MADVTVDMTPKEKLPYDPNDIPEAVRKRVAQVESMYTASAAPAGEQPPEQSAPPLIPQSPPQVSAPAAPASPSVMPATPPAPAAPADPLDENDLSWKTRFLAMQGRYAASTKTIGEMQEQMSQLGNELMHAQQQRPTQPRKPRAQTNYLTEKDVENYGPELIEVTQRAALQAVAPQIQEVEQQNAALRKQLAIEARRRMDQAVEAGVPNYKEIDQNPRWHRWLLGIDVLSGRVRQQLLNEAISGGSAPRVISFFKGFLQEEAATGHIEPAQFPATSVPREAAVPLASLAAPGRARPATGGDTSVPPDKPIYTRAQIAQLYRMHQKGAYTGREAEWARQDADIIAAGREGRIR